MTIKVLLAKLVFWGFRGLWAEICIWDFQRTQYPLIKEHALKYRGLHIVNEGRFLNEGVLGCPCSGVGRHLAFQGSGF